MLQVNKCNLCSRFYVQLIINNYPFFPFLWKRTLCAVTQISHNTYISKLRNTLLTIQFSQPTQCFKIVQDNMRVSRADGSVNGNYRILCWIVFPKNGHNNLFLLTHSFRTMPFPHQEVESTFPPLAPGWAFVIALPGGTWGHDALTF